MSKYIILIVLVALRIIYQPVTVSGATPGFSNSCLSSCTAVMASAKLVDFTAILSNEKVYLKWSVTENESADIFEIEKSTDGKNFVLAAMVFSTDKADIDHYEFYEKAGKKKILYRIKVINKDKKTAYSPIVGISPLV